MESFIRLSPHIGFCLYAEWGSQLVAELEILHSTNSHPPIQRRPVTKTKHTPQAQIWKSNVILLFFFSIRFSSPADFCHNFVFFALFLMLTHHSALIRLHPLFCVLTSSERKRSRTAEKSDDEALTDTGVRCVGSPGDQSVGEIHFQPAIIEVLTGLIWSSIVYSINEIWMNKRMTDAKKQESELQSDK